MILSDAATIDHYTDTGVWGGATIDEIFRNTVQNVRDMRALADAANRSEITGQDALELNYGDLDAAIDRLAGHFIKIGLMPGDIVAAQLPNTIEQIVLILAASRSGVIVSPLPLMWREYELAKSLPLIAPKAIISATNIAGRNHADMMRYVAAETISVRFVLAFGEGHLDGVEPLDWIFASNDAPDEDVEWPEVSANNVLTICWASGRHAAPSPVPRSHNQWIAAGLMNLLESDIRQGATLLSPYPLSGLVPIGVFFMPWLLSGGTLLLHHPFDLGYFVEQLQTQDVEFTALPPSVVDVLKAEQVFQNAKSLSAIGCIWPSPYLPANAHKRGTNLPVPVIDIRGFGEMAYFARKRHSNDRPGLIPHGECCAPSGAASGPLLMTTRVRGGAMQNGNETSLLAGDLMIKSAMMFDAYYPGAVPGADEPTLERDAHGFVNTGMRCRFVGSSKPSIDCTRRENSVIYHGGMAMSATELDLLYSEHEKLADAAAFTFEDAVMGDRIMAAVVPSPGADISLDEFVNWLNERRVAACKIPDRLVVVKTIPRNANGDVLRDQMLDEI